MINEGEQDLEDNHIGSNDKSGDLSDSLNEESKNKDGDSEE